MLGNVAYAPQMPGPARTLPRIGWSLAGACAALAVGIGASQNPTTAIAVAVVIAALLAVFVRPVTLLPILAASVLLEQIRVEGATISRALAPIALLTVIVELVRGRVSIHARSPLIWACAYTVWALASGLWTVSTGRTVTSLSSLAIALVYMLSFALLPNSRRDLERVLWAFALASLVLGAVSFPQVSRALHMGSLLQEGRSQGGVGDPDYFAATQLVVLPLILVLAGEARKRWVQVALGGMFLVITGSILTSLSRGGLIGLAVLLVLLVLAPFDLIFRSRRSKAIALVAIAVGVTALSIQSSSSLARRIGPLFSSQGNLSAQQGSGRTELWKAAWASVGQHPWLGLGYGGFAGRSGDLLLETPGVDLSYYSIRPKGAPAHNTYLGSLADLGLLGPVLYLGLLVSTGYTLRRTARRAREAGGSFFGRVAGALLLGLVTWSITSIFLSTETTRTFWIVVGLSLALPRLLRVEEKREEANPSLLTPKARAAT
jgi:O-antigen ligase